MLKPSSSLIFILAFVIVLCGCSKHPQTTPYQWRIPYNLPTPDLSDEVQMSEQSVELGRHLFYEQKLSGNGTMACASCHQQGFAFAEKKARSEGSQGDEIKRNALALVNLAYSQSFTWAHDSLPSIEAQLHLPLFNEFPIEMGITGNETRILKRLNTANYQALFYAAYGDKQADFSKIISALADFVRSLTSFNSAFDRYAYGGDDSALSEQAIQGMNLFFSEKTECFHCHGGMNFAESSQHSSQQFRLKAFHNTGLGADENDLGLYEITRNPADKARFKAPTLRNIANSAPYMHDGSFNSLSEVIDFYAAGGRGHGKHEANKSAFVKGFNLSAEEKQQLIAFLHSLSDDRFLTNPAHSAPFAVPDK